jgi:hypothetical protein
MASTDLINELFKLIGKTQKEAAPAETKATKLPKDLAAPTPPKAAAKPVDPAQYGLTGGKYDPKSDVYTGTPGAGAGPLPAPAPPGALPQAPQPTPPAGPAAPAAKPFSQMSPEEFAAWEAGKPPPRPKPITPAQQFAPEDYQKQVIDWYAQIAFADAQMKYPGKATYEHAVEAFKAMPLYKSMGGEFAMKVEEAINNLKPANLAKPANLSKPGESQMTPEQGKKWVQAFESQATQLKPGKPVTAQISPDAQKLEEQRQKRRVQGRYTTPAFHGGILHSYPESQSPTGKKWFMAAQEDLSQLYNSNVSKYWLNTEDYHMFNAKGESWGTIGRKAIDEASKAGKKGIIVHNVADEPNLTMSQLGPQTTYVIFDSGTARSDKASFDPKQFGLPGMLASGAAIAIGGSTLGGDKAEAGVPKKLLLYHASPADFEKFELRPRTGEGNADFAHGIYGAENEKTMEYYAQMFARDRGKAVRYLAEKEVDPDKLLDFDKAFAEQSKDVQHALIDAGILNLDWRRESVKANVARGQDYDPKVEFLNPEESAKLHEAGLEGVKYLDAGSRALGEGTHNYVVFNPDTLKIIKKWGLTGLMAGPSAALSMLRPDEAEAAGLPPELAAPDPGATEGRTEGPGLLPEHLRAPDVPREIPEPNPRHYLENVKNIATDFLNAVDKAKGTFRELNAKRTGTAGQLTNPLEAARASYGRGAKSINDLVPGASQEARGTRAQEFLRLFNTVAGTDNPVIAGPWRSMVARPMARNWVQDTEEARQRFESSSVSERARQSAKQLFEKPLEGKETLEQKTDLAMDISSFFVPGMGMKYNEIGKGIKNFVTATAKSGPFRYIQTLLNPESLSQEADIVSQLLRGAGGTAARDTAAAHELLGAGQKVINGMPLADRLDFIDHIEGGPAKILHLPPALQRLGLDMRNSFKRVEQKLAALPSTAQMDFVENYFPHMWKDPNAASAFAKQGGGGASKQGSGASLKKRTVPSVADGIRAGLEPITSDPIEIAMRYLASMNKFTGTEAVREVMIQTGLAKWAKPQLTGASGHPNAFIPPADHVKLNGRGAVRGDGAELYAPKEAAAVYNNAISRGFYDSPIGPALDIMQRATNSQRMLELGLSGFHGTTMTMESITNRMTQGIYQVVGGAMDKDLKRVMGGLGKMGTSMAGPVLQTSKGSQLRKVYLGAAGDPLMEHITNLLEHAGGRAVGSRHARDYSMSAVGSYWDAFRKGALKAQLQADMVEAKGGMWPSLKVGFRHVGRIFETTMQPIFDYYIPRLKDGAFYDAMADWLKANPTATYAQQAAQARKIWDSMDNRFGELVTDNIFWDAHLKQTAQLMLRSYSWDMGTLREIGGGVKDLLSGQWTQRAAYIFGLTAATAMVSGIISKLHNQNFVPESVEDLVAPKTGGVQSLNVPSTGFGRSAVSSAPERMAIPSYMKDVLGWYENWQQEAKNKLATAAKMPFELISNTDWKGDPIINPESTAPEWAKAWLKYTIDAFTPISAKPNVPKDSKITTLEQRLGFRQAPGYVADPEGYQRQQHNLNLRAQRRKAAADRRREQRYGGTE